MKHEQNVSQSTPILVTSSIFVASGKFQMFTIGTGVQSETESLACVTHSNGKSVELQARRMKGGMDMYVTGPAGRLPALKSQNLKSIHPAGSSYGRIE